MVAAPAKPAFGLFGFGRKPQPVEEEEEEEEVRPGSCGCGLHAVPVLQCSSFVRLPACVHRACMPSNASSAAVCTPLPTFCQTRGL